MGNKDHFHSFETFVDKVSDSKISFKNSNVKYTSPSQGEISVGWSKKLRVNGRVIMTDKYKRYDNATSNTPFGSNEIQIVHKNEKINLSIK